MQEYPAYYDQVVLRFFFYDYSTLLQINSFYITVKNKMDM